MQSRPPIKQKSISDSNLGSFSSTPRHTPSQSSPAGVSGQKLKNNGRPEVVADMDQKQPSSSASSFNTSFSSMQIITEQASTVALANSNGTDLLSFQLSTSGTSSFPPQLNFTTTFSANGGDGDGYLPKTTNIVTAAAAPDSGYHQMPSSFQSGTEYFGDLNSPLTPMDSEVGSFSSMDSSNLVISRKDLSDSNAPVYNPSNASVTSDYLSATDSAVWPPSVGSETSTNGHASFGAMSESSTSWNPFGSSSSYLPSGGGSSETDGLKQLSTYSEGTIVGSDVSSTNQMLASHSSISSTTSTFSPPSFSEASHDISYTKPNPSVSGYLPSTDMYSQRASEATSESEALLQENDDDDEEVDFTAVFSNSANGAPKSETSAPTTGANSSQVNFPMSFSNYSTDGEEFDEFDLPPLPDSLNTPATSAGGGVNGSSSHGGGSFVGSIVTLGTPTTNN